jgi:hypothetical protein
MKNTNDTTRIFLIEQEGFNKRIALILKEVDARTHELEKKFVRIMRWFSIFILFDILYFVLHFIGLL